jgi:hypothetical protein
VMLRVPAFGVVVTGGRRAVLFTLLLVAVVLTGGVFDHVFGWSLAVAALIVGVWILGCVRLLRMSAVGPAGPDGPGTGTSGVREPRRPWPRPPAGSLALAIPIDPDRIVALG